MKLLHVGIAIVVIVVGSARLLPAQLLVPGTGQRMVKVGDDFEEPNWNYVFNNPKSSDEQDKQQRLPAGRSANGRWYEGVMRGHPDVIRRVPTPEGGIEGSEGALLMVSRQTGIPGSYSRTMQQDDLIVDVQSRLGYSIPVSWSPNVVVRVYLPPFEEWERRTGPSFGFRAACDTHRMKPNKKSKSRWGGGGGRSWQQDTYWPGLFIQFHRGDGKSVEDSASLSVRAGPSGQDFVGPKIKELGWWTLGMSFTPDGRVHYSRGPASRISRPRTTLRRRIRTAFTANGSTRFFSTSSAATTETGRPPGSSTTRCCTTRAASLSFARRLFNGLLEQLDGQGRRVHVHRLVPPIGLGAIQRQVGIVQEIQATALANWHARGNAQADRDVRSDL